MDIDNFKPAIVYTIYIASTPEKVWQALTIGGIQPAVFLRLCGRGRVRVGGAFVVRAPDGSVHITGEVIECDPPRKLTVTFNVNWPGLWRARADAGDLRDRASRRTVKLTMLQSHDRPISDDILSGGRQGWPAILSSLKSVLETGKPLTIRWSRRSGCWRR